MKGIPKDVAIELGYTEMPKAAIKCEEGTTPKPKVTTEIKPKSPPPPPKR